MSDNSRYWIVDDSEPEREAARRNRRKQHRKSRDTTILHEPAVKSPTVSTLCSSEEVAHQKHFDLSAFAHAAARRKTETDSDKSQSARSTPTPPHPTRSSPNLLSSLFTDAELSLLSACPSCGARWTCNKTFDKKLLHIQRCAMRKNLSHDTLCQLLRAEINTPSPTINAAAASQVSQSNQITLFQGVVQHHGPPKRVKRIPRTASVKAIEHVAGSIRNKAAQLIADQDSTEDQPTADYPISTQQFGVSSLAQRMQTAPSMSRYLNEANDSNEPKTTVETLSLNQRMTKDDGNDIGEAGLAYCHTKSMDASTPNSPNDYPDGKNDPLAHETTHPSRYAPTLDSRHFVSSDETSDGIDNDCATPPLQPLVADTLSGENLHPQQQSSADRTTSNQVELESKLCALLSQDVTLYSRILRNEPIPFDIFWNKVLSITPDRAGLRKYLGNFLDSQCITFHSMVSESSKRRRKVRSR